MATAELAAIPPLLPSQPSADPPAIDRDKYYSLRRAAKLTGVSRDVLRARCESGVIPCVRPAGVAHPHRRILGSDLIAFLLASGVKTATTAKVVVTAPPVPVPTARMSAALLRRREAEHQRALEEIGCG